MKNQKKQFVMAMIALAMFLLVYFGIGIYNDRQDEKAEKAGAGNVTVTDFAAEDVTAFSYLLDGNILSFTKNDGIWTYDGDAALDMDEDVIANMLEKVCSLSLESGFTDYDNLEDYGLAEPSNRISLTTDTETITILFGGTNEITGEYYLMIDGEEMVYAVDSTVVSAFDHTVEELTVVEEETEDTQSTEDTKSAEGTDNTTESADTITEDDRRN